MKSSGLRRIAVLIKNKLFVSLARLWEERDEISIKNIRPDHWQYFLAFPVIMVINNVSEGFFQYDIMPLGISLFAYLFGATEIAALLTVLSPVRFLKKYVVVWPACLLAGTLACMLLPKGPLWVFFAVCYWAGVGGCGACAFYAYAFILRNAERFLGIVFIAFNIGLDVFLYKSGYASAIVMNILLLALVSAVATCIFRFKLTDHLPRQDNGEPNRRIPLSAHSFLICVTVFSIIVMFGDCGMLSVAGQGCGGHLLFGAGNMAAAVLAVVMQINLHRSIWHSWNSFLGFSIIGLGLMMTQNATVVSYGALVYGLARGMGNISLFYLGGGLLKRYSSLSLFRKTLFCFCFLMAVSNTVSQIITSYIPEYAIYIAVAASIVLLVFCVLASPVFYQHVFFHEWMDEYRSMDVSVFTEQITNVDRFENLGLSPREKEVCALLLNGRTLRQISGDLSISEYTANGYCKALYRKLGINSKADLFIRFGMPDNNDNTLILQKNIF